MAANQMQLEDWLDDLCVRFIINLPQEDLSSVARICFQVEEAQWFYEDFVRPLDPSLPSMTLRMFCLRIFQHCPLLASFPVEAHIQAFEEFLQYKTRVPVRGAIMLNHAMDSVVLVKGWKKGASWSFPRGKINKDEDDLDCAIREVYEETGMDLREAGLVPTEAKPKYIEIPMREQHLRLYVFRNVPMDTHFQPRTRKEISKIEWYKLSDLPTLRKKGSQNQHQYDSSGPGANSNKFYMVAPFLVPLKKWIVSQKKAVEKKLAAVDRHVPIEEEPTEDEAWVTDTALKVAPIDSLDGATRELQRLLNVQPKAEPTRAEPPPSGDKASALLSLLQPAATQPLMPHAHADRHMTDRNMTDTTQHRSPDAHQHQAAPPSSTLPPTQVYQGWNAFTQSHLQGQSGAVPPEIQPRFADYLASQPFLGHLGVGGPQSFSRHPVPPQQAQAPPFGASMLQNATPQAGFPHAPMPASLMPPPGQPGLSPGIAKRAPLNEQAMALLSAFKQGPCPSASKASASKEVKGDDHAAQQQQQQQQPPQHRPAPYSQYTAQPRTPGSVPAGPKAAVEMVVNQARPAQHKSALLDLFKTQSPGPSQQQPPSDRVSILTRDTRAKPCPPPPVVHAKTSGRSPRSTSTAKSGPQPTRILQRGQSLQPVSERPDAAASPEPTAVPTYGVSSRSPGYNPTEHTRQHPLAVHAPSDRHDPQLPSQTPVDSAQVQSPMSQADQSFLLDYLQSVTLNAGR